MYRLIFASIFSSFITTTCFAESLPKSERAPEIRLHGDHINFPIVMVREFPFIEGEVAGVRGKWMLDTGAEQALAVNDHRVLLRDGKIIGKGLFGSGQTFDVTLRPAVQSVRIGPLSYANATQVASQNAQQLEKITPDFLGWIGYWFWSGYALKLDYQRSQATFYHGSPSDYLENEQIIAELPFELRKLPNQPIMHVKIGSTDFVAAFDSGQYGTIYTDAETLHRLTRDGYLRSSHADKEKFDVSGLLFNSGVKAVIPAMDVSTSPFAAAQPIGLSETNIIAIGYGLLRQYKTVWDFKRRRIYLLKPTLKVVGRKAAEEPRQRKQ